MSVALLQADASAFRYMAFKAINERILIVRVQVRLRPKHAFIDFKLARTSADYWQVNDYSQIPVSELNPEDPLDMLIQCCDGQRQCGLGLIPTKHVLQLSKS